MIKSVLLLIMLFSADPNDSIDFLSPAEILLKSAELTNENQLDEAIDELLSVSENDSSYIEVQAELMPVYNAAKKYNKTIEIGNKLKDEFSKFRSNIYITLGNAYLNGGLPEKGVETYTEGLKFFPYHHILLYNLGLGYQKLGMNDKALVCFQKSARINPYYGSNHIMLGYLAMLQGHRTKAMLSYLTYLAINPDRNSTLIFLENLSNDAIRSEGSVSPFTDNELFANYDDIIRSKAALDSRFQLDVDFNASIVKQTELLLSKLEYKTKSNDFWMNYYVPMFTNLVEKKLDGAFIYFILQSANNENVTSWLEKHEEEKTEWIKIANVALSNNRLIHEAEIMGEKRLYNFWYFDDHLLSAIGNQIDDDTRIGPWAFYNKNGQLNAIGKYNDSGQKIGQWNYYHENGRLSREEKFNDHGVYIAPAEYYYDSGALSIVANYKENELHGDLAYYYGCGLLRETIPYDNGVKSGEGFYYFNTGEKEIDYTLEDGEYNGVYSYYFKNGQLDRKYTYDKGITSGDYMSYYIDGGANETGKYENNNLEGDWSGYHPNGKRSYEGTFKEDKRCGKWINYHTNGNVSEEIFYNDSGNIDGEYTSYFENGNLNSIVNYEDGKIVACKIYKSNDEIIDDMSNAEGNIDFERHFPEGGLKIKSTLKDGKFNGLYYSYFRNGNPHQKGEMVNDQYHGDYVEYYSTGQTLLKCQYKNGKKDGYYQKYYKNGSLNMEGWYVDDKEEQLWTSYHPDGSLLDETYYIGGKPNGWIKHYGPGNKIDYTLKIENNLITELKQYDSLGSAYHHLKIPYGNGVFARKSTDGDTTFRSEIRCGQLINTGYSYFANSKIESIDPKNTFGEKEKFEAYAIDGALSVEGYYKYGQKNGDWKYYHSNGTVKSERYYERDNLEKTLKYFYYNGQLESVCEYTEDEPHGSCRYYDHSGNLQLVKLYDKVDGVKAYIDVKSGDTIQFSDRDKFIITSHFPNGKVASKQHYLSGVYDGNVSYYNENGSPTESINYKFGELEGMWNTYYANGKKFIEINYTDGLRNGIEKEYFENGKIKRETPYVNDRKHGEEIIYNQQGSVKTTTYFWNNEVY